MKISVFSYALLCLLAISLVCCESKDENLKDESGSNDKWEFAYAENYVDSLDAIFCHEGHTILYGFKKNKIYQNSHVESRVVYVFKTDFDNGNLDLEDATVLVVDSTFFPVRIVNKNLNMVLTRRDDNHFNYASYNFSTNTWEEHYNIEFELPQNKFNTRSLSSDGYSKFNYSDVLVLLSIAKSLGIALHEDFLSGIMGAYGDVLSQNKNIPKIDEISLAAGVCLAGNLSGAILAVSNYLISKIDQLVVEALGEVKISIENIEQNSTTSCRATYKVDGLNDNGIQNSRLFLDIFSYKDLKMERVNLPSKNGENMITLEKLSSGRYGSYLFLTSTKFPIIIYKTEPLVLFDVFNLFVDKYEMDTPPTCKNGTISFKMDIFLQGDESNLKDVEQFGFYTRFANAIPDYRPIDKLSSIFESTPLTYELNIEKEGFFEENKDYSKFEAVATGYYIGAYVVTKSNNITHLGEKPINGLIYKEKPFTITKETISTTETSATFVCEYGNNSFWNLTCGVEYCWEGNKSEIYLEHLEDGEHKITLTELKPNTTYTYRSFMKYGNKYLYADNEKTFTTNSGCHIDFNIEYPNYSDSKADEVVCRVALLPVYENEDQRNSIIKKYTVLYKDGKEVTRSSYEYSDRIILTHVFKREELSVDYVNYTAVPKDGHWQVSMEFEKLNEKGEIITMPTDVMKDVNLKYDTKPVMVIYKCDIGRCDAYPDPNYTHDEHRFLIKMSSFTRGSFWRKSWIGNSSNEVIDGKVHWFGDDFSLGGNWGVDYTNNNKPNQLLMEFKDYNGNVIKSNSIPIQTNEKGCVIESHYDNTSEVISKYGKQWNF